MSSFGSNGIIKAKAPGPDGASERARPQKRSSRLSPIAESIASLPVKPGYSHILIESLARLTDFIVLMVSALVVFRLYFGSFAEFDAAYSAMLPLVSIAALFAFQTASLYQLSALRRFAHALPRLAAAWTLVFLVALASIFFMKSADAFSRVFLVSWFWLGLLVLSLTRIAISSLLRQLARSGRLDRRTVLVGGGEPAESLIKLLESEKEMGLQICGVFDDRTDSRSPEVIANYPKLGTVDELVEFARRTRVDLVIFTLPVTAEQRILQMLRTLSVLPIDIRLSAHMAKLRLRPRSYSYIGSVPVLDLSDRPIAEWDLVLKWVFDKVIGWTLLVVLSPILLLIALSVKLDSKGRVFFRQKRLGFNNEIVEIFKFRSMYVEDTDPAAAKLVTPGDPRVTRVGRFIRKTSLDELPQLLNVAVFGNLSLVGPRPHALQAKAADRLYDQVVDGYFSRHRVKPGITGWAQVHGWRGETDTQEKIQKRVEHDLYYIENWSLFFDLKILMMTPGALLNPKNAY
ncbi:MAG: undecaprenyl-phosphate glucose phosphotransferase [Hyphomicrobiales bacterium]|nr:undecaprenyl-phosphate glucose phosphotransferase [Hyphomicrobiales bacterium]MBV9520271.1 undecaprenyl-phosphate glucose phosphotransferase [Hyphomicrobiales bacterium]